MRENMGLFRGKRIDNGEWTFGYYVEAKHRWHNYGIHKEWIVCSAAANGGWFTLQEKHAVKGETIGECTGLKDKNGKLIFEGDVCRNTRTGEIVSVKWHGTMAGYVWSKPTGNGHLFDFGELFMAYDKYVIIGNIHDNPELIEEAYHHGE